MLLHTDKALFDALKVPMLYQQQTLGVDYTPTHTVNVVRYGSDEYTKLLTNPNIPHISVQYLKTNLTNPPAPLGYGHRIGKVSTDVDNPGVWLAPHPEPCRVDYQLDIRSPHDIWLRQIELEITRNFARPLYTATLNMKPWGEDAGTTPFKVRYFFKDIGRQGVTQDQTSIKMLRSVWRVEAWTWILSKTSEAELVKQYKTAEIEIRDATTDQLLDELVLP